jgi:hypothetical protein
VCGEGMKRGLQGVCGAMPNSFCLTISASFI